MACCQHPAQKKTTWKDGLGGCNQAPTPHLARDGMRGKRKQEDPHRSVREDEMVTQTMGSTQACVRLASVWECLGKHAFFSPPTPAHAQNTLLPCLEHMVHQQRHLAALTPGSCASSLPVGSLGTATSSTTCGSSRVRRRAMNYFEAAAANLTFIQEIHCKHMLAAKSETQPCNNARLTGCRGGGGRCLEEGGSVQMDVFICIWFHVSVKDEVLFASVFTTHTHGYSRDVNMTTQNRELFGNSVCLGLSGLHQAALVCLFVPVKDYISQNERNGWMTFQLSNSGFTNEGFQKQGHFPEELYIHFNCGLVGFTVK